MPRVARSPFLSGATMAWSRLRPAICPHDIAGREDGRAEREGAGTSSLKLVSEHVSKRGSPPFLLFAKAESSRVSVAARAQPTWRPSTRMLRKFHLVRPPEQPIDAHIEFVCNFSEPINVERS